MSAVLEIEDWMKPTPRITPAAKAARAAAQLAKAREQLAGHPLFPSKLDPEAARQGPRASIPTQTRLPKAG